MVFGHKNMYCIEKVDAGFITNLTSGCLPIMKMFSHITKVH
jgi:hypothetical protein